jgi:hypothetical protein
MLSECSVSACIGPLTYPPAHLASILAHTSNQTTLRSDGAGSRPCTARAGGRRSDTPTPSRCCSRPVCPSTSAPPTAHSPSTWHATMLPPASCSSAGRAARALLLPSPSPENPRRSRTPHPKQGSAAGALRCLQTERAPPAAMAAGTASEASSRPSPSAAGRAA